MPIATPHTSIMAQTRFGSRKGNFSKSVPGGKSLGKFLHGWARVPPRAGPRIDLFKALAQLGLDRSIRRGLHIPKTPYKRHDGEGSSYTW